MFQVNNNDIGKYISHLIEKQGISMRQFCKEYLRKYNMIYNSKNICEPTADEIQNMANRMSQIKNGRKSIQPYDLPIFATLLEVSIEQLLSAGKYNTTTLNRYTNYSIAISKNPDEWKTYIEHDEKPILNPDEYGKTAIDYAIQFGNFEFLKFLIENNYIWFDSQNENDYVLTFGAGTSIQRREPFLIDDYLPYKLATEDQLRIDIISLATQNNDIQTLKTLRAREIPELYYQSHYLSCTHPDINRRYDKNMICHISNSSDEILDYFSDEFEIRDHIKYLDGKQHSHTFMYPYLTPLLDMMICNQSSFLEPALKKAIDHNVKTYQKLVSLITESIKNGCYRDDNWQKEFDFYENGDIISFRDTYSKTGIITNLIRTKKKSTEPCINHLIAQLNDSYNKVRNIKAINMIGG